jgi:hypothetical protein
MCIKVVYGRQRQAGPTRVASPGRGKDRGARVASPGSKHPHGHCSVWGKSLGGGSTVIASPTVRSCAGTRSGYGRSTGPSGARAGEAAYLDNSGANAERALDPFLVAPGAETLHWPRSGQGWGR